MPHTVYQFPLNEIYSEAIHTPAGVKAIIESSNIMRLLRDMAADGHDVTAPAAELVALMNYVTSSQGSMRDIQSHLDYCKVRLQKEIA